MSSSGVRKIEDDISKKLEEIYKLIKDVLELVQYTIAKWMEIQSKYGEVIDVLTSPDEFRNFVNKLDDASAGKLLRMIMQIYMIVQKMTRLSDLSEEELKNLKKDVAELLERVREELKTRTSS